MKKNITLILALACALALNAQNVKVLNDGYDNLTVSFQSPELSVSRVVANGESFDVISLDGYVNRGIVGQPSLPVLHSRIEMPVCESFTVSVSNAVYDTIDGSAIGLFRPILPQQPLRIKSDTTKHENVIDESDLQCCRRESDTRTFRSLHFTGFFGRSDAQQPDFVKRDESFGADTYDHC